MTRINWAFHLVINQPKTFLTLKSYCYICTLCHCFWCCFHYSLQVFKPFDPIYQLNWRSMCCLSTHEIFWGAQGTLPRERNATTCTHGAQCESSCCSPCGVSRASKKRCRHRRGGKFLVLSVQGRSKDPTPSELYTNLQAKRSSKCFKAKKQSFVYISFLPF